MKKTILVSLVAVMMLFAFTACEQPVPGLSKAIIDADIVQNGTFLVGQPFDASKFSVNVTYSDGTKGTLEGVNVTTTGDADSVKNGDKVSVTLPTAAPNYSGNNVATSNTTFNGSLVAYSIKSLAVTGPATVSSVDGKVAAPKVADLKAVATYFDSTGTAQTYNLEAYDLGIITSGNGSAAFVDSDVTAVSADKPTAAATVTVYVKWQSGANGVFNYTVQYAGDDEPTPAAEYEWYDNMIVYRQVPASSTVKYFQRGVFNADSMIELYKVYAPTTTADSVAASSLKDFYLVPLTTGQGEELSLELSSASQLNTTNKDRFAANATATVDMSYTYILDEAYGATDEITAVVGSISGTKTDEDGNLVPVVSGTGNGITAGTTISLSNIRADYTTSMSGRWLGKGGTTTVPTTTGYDKGNTIAPAEFVVTVSWASGYSDTTVTTLSNGFTVNPGTAPSIETTDNAYQVTLTYAAGAGEYTNAVNTCTVPVTVNADPDFSA